MEKYYQNCLKIYKIKYLNEVDLHDLTNNLKKIYNADKELGRGVTSILTRLQ